MQHLHQTQSVNIVVLGESSTLDGRRLIGLICAFGWLLGRTAALFDTEWTVEIVAAMTNNSLFDTTDLLVINSNRFQLTQQL